MRYLRGTVDHGNKYIIGPSNDFEGYCDADWAGDTNGRKFTSGYVFHVCQDHLLAGGARSRSA